MGRDAPLGGCPPQAPAVQWGREVVRFAKQPQAHKQSLPPLCEVRAVRWEVGGGWARRFCAIRQPMKRQSLDTIWVRPTALLLCETYNILAKFYPLHRGTFKIS
jgi:hypothetical protein